MASTLEQRLEALEERIQLLDILQLEGDYCRTWDFGTGQEWAELFTEDGIFEMRGTASVAPLPSGQDTKIVGREALAAFHGAFHEGWSFLHQMHLPSCRINGDTAEAVVIFDCPIKATDGTGRAAIWREIGTYRVQYRRTAEGWKIAQRLEEAIIRDSQMFFGNPNANMNI